MASSGPGAYVVPPLPPAPLQSTGSPVLFSEIPPPWTVLLLAALAKLVSGGVSMGGPARGYFASPVTAAVYLGISVVFGVAMVLGAAVLDRLYPRSSRSLRWMVGMALPGFIPWTLLLVLPSMVFGQLTPALLSVLLQMAYDVVTGAIAGLALGLAADRAEGLYLRLVLAGLAAGLARTVAYVPVLLASLAAYGRPLPAPGAGYWGSVVLAQCAFGVLLALAIAACLSAAWRARSGEGDLPPLS